MMDVMKGYVAATKTGRCGVKGAALMRMVNVKRIAFPATNLRRRSEMRRLLNTMLLGGLVTVSVILNAPERAAAQESAYDQSQDTAGASQDAERYSDWDAYNSAREKASEGFDTGTDNRLQHGNQYIPMPTPKIDKDYSNTNE